MNINQVPNQCLLITPYILAQQIKDTNSERQKAIMLTEEESSRLLCLKIDQLKASMDKNHVGWTGRVELRIRELRDSSLSKRLEDQLKLVKRKRVEDHFERLSYQDLLIHYDFMDSTWLALNDTLYLNETTRKTKSRK